MMHGQQNVKSVIMMLIEQCVTA